MLKRILSGLCVIGAIAYFSLSVIAIDPTIYRGNKNTFGGIYVSTFSINPTAFNGTVAKNGDITSPIISSTTYINKADVTIWGDKNGSDIFISSSANMHTYTGYDCVKLYPGEPIVCGGKNLDAIFARTLAGSTNGTTVWYIISYQDK